MDHLVIFDSWEQGCLYEPALEARLPLKYSLPRILVQAIVSNYHGCGIFFGYVPTLFHQRVVELLRRRVLPV